MRIRCRSLLLANAEYVGMTMTRRFLFVLGSARPDGNSALLARRAAEQLPPDVEQQWIDLTAHPLPEFEDLRHDSDHVRPTEGTTALLLDATLAATDLVIVSPLYWYAVSAQTKRYLDHWSGWLRTPAWTSRTRWRAARSGASPRSRTRSPRSPTRWSAR